MLRPAATFPILLAATEPAGPWMVWRRPLAIAGLLGCVASLVASGVLTVRLIVPAALVWSYVPIAQVLALVAVTWRRRRAAPYARAVDLFFAGHGPWALFLIGIATSLAFLPPEFGWTRIRIWLGGMAGVMIWSAYLDFWFFRTVYRASPAAAVRDVVLVRAISWTLIFWIFAVPDATPLGIIGQVAEAVRELTT